MAGIVSAAHHKAALEAQIRKDKADADANNPSGDRESLRGASSALKEAVEPTAENSADQEDGAVTCQQRFFQDEVSKWYQSFNVQISVAVLIFGNFLVGAIDAEFHFTDRFAGCLCDDPDAETCTFNWRDTATIDDDPKPGCIEHGESPGASVLFMIFEYFFTIVFTIELIVNMWSAFWWNFWMSGWNVFDFIIVVISLLAVTPLDIPGLSVLRLFRAFRVFRLFKRIESLRMIIEGVIASLPGVCNAFVVLILIMSIWSIMGVDFFQNVVNESGDGDRRVGSEFFGSFSRALFSMWQVMTMDSWASGIARPIMFNEYTEEWDTEMSLKAGIFFVLFTFIAGIVMLNVVVAILLDKYLEQVEKSKKEKREKKDQEDKAIEESQRQKREDEVALNPPKVADVEPSSIPESLEFVSGSLDVQLEGRLTNLEIKLDKILSRLDQKTGGLQTF